MADYSPDVEINHNNELAAARDIAEGELIRIPLHMIDKAKKSASSADKFHQAWVILGGIS